MLEFLFAPIYNLDCVTTDEHIAKAREMIVDISHPIIGNMKVNGNPVKLMTTKAKIDMPAPSLGKVTRRFIMVGLVLIVIK